MIFGYARVSRFDQSLDRQIDFLKSKNCDEIITEKMSGTIKDRPGLTQMMEKLRAGDIVVIESFSRLGRSVKNLIDIMDELTEKKVMVVSQKESFDTTTPHGKLMLTIFQAFSQFERDLIRERTLEGLASARARGKKGGRLPVNSKKLEMALKMYDSRDFSVRQIAKLTGISLTTIYKFARARPGGLKGNYIDRRLKELGEEVEN